MNTSTPVLPLVANPSYGHHHDQHRGLEGKDAVLIHSNQTALNAHLLNESVSRNSKEDAIKTLEAGCSNERTSLQMENRLAQSIRDEAERTRNFLMQQEITRLNHERSDGRFNLIEKLIGDLIPKK